MTISPYTMDILYRNGTIDYVPYDLMMPTQVAMPTQPLTYQASATPLAYGQDRFTKNTTQSPSVAMNALGMADDYNAQVAEVTEYRNSLTKGAEKNTSIYKSKNSFIKGFISLSVLIATVVLLIKGCKASTNNCKSLLEKLNPVNWFKK